MRRQTSPLRRVDRKLARPFFSSRDGRQAERKSAEISSRLCPRGPSSCRCPACPGHHVLHLLDMRLQPLWRGTSMSWTSSTIGRRHMPAPEHDTTNELPRNTARCSSGTESRTLAWSLLVAMPDDRAPRWVTMLGATGREDAQRSADGKFGPGRVLDLRPGVVS